MWILSDIRFDFRQVARAKVVRGYAKIFTLKFAWLSRFAIRWKVISIKETGVVRL